MVKLVTTPQNHGEDPRRLSPREKVPLLKYSGKIRYRSYELLLYTLRSQYSRDGVYKKLESYISYFLLELLCRLLPAPVGPGR